MMTNRRRAALIIIICALLSAALILPQTLWAPPSSVVSGGDGSGDPTPETEIDLRDKGGQPGACDATKAAANDAAWTAALADLAAPPAGTRETGGKINLGRNVWCFGHTVFVKDKVQVYGDGARPARIEALARFSDTTVNEKTGLPVNVLVELGNGNGSRQSFAFHSFIENVVIDANSVPGLVPLFSQQANEGGGVDQLLITGFTDIGVWFATGSSGIRFTNSEVYGDAGAGVNGSVRLESWLVNRIDNITVNHTSGTAPDSSGIWFNGLDGTIWTGSVLHCEFVETCIKHTNSDTVLSSLQGHDSVTNVATYDAGSAGTVSNVINGCCDGGSDFTVKDATPGGKNFTSRVIGPYKIAPDRPVVTGSRAVLGPQLSTVIQVQGDHGLVNDQTTP